jgi:hypothetical protein
MIKKEGLLLELSKIEIKEKWKVLLYMKNFIQSKNIHSFFIFYDFMNENCRTDSRNV